MQKVECCAESLGTSFQLFFEESFMHCFALRLKQRGIARFFFLWTCLLVCCDSIVFAQPFLSVKPIGLDSNFRNKLTESSKINGRFLPTVNVDSLLQEEKKLFDKDIDDARNGKFVTPRAMRFATAIKSSMNMQNSGTWDELPDGTRVWRLRLISPGAFSLGFTFDQFYLPEGARFFLYNELEREQQILGAFTSAHNAANGKLATVPVYGSIIVLEYSEPPTSKRKGRVSINTIALGYRNIVEYGKQSGSYSSSTSVNTSKVIKDDELGEIKTQSYFGVGGTDDKPCMANTDVNCPQFSQFSDIKRSVLFIYVTEVTQ